MTSLTLFTLALAGLVLSKRLLGDFFSPPAVYNFFWAFALGCLELGLVSYDPLRAPVWNVMLLAYLGFMGGCAAVWLYAASKSHWLRAEPALDHIDKQRLERALIFLFLLGVFGFAVQLVHLQAQIGLSAFLSSPQLAREAYSNIKYLGFFNLLNVANFALALMYLLLYKKPSKWVLLIMLWAIATTLVTTDRTRFFYMVIWSFFLAVYLFRRVNITPKMIAGLCVTIISLFGFFLLVAKIYKKQAYDDNMEFVNAPPEYSALIDPYIYLTGSFPVLQAFLNDQHTLAYGKHTLSPIVTVLETAVPDFAREELAGKFYRVPIELNACTYLEPFYKDFGTVGVLLGPLVLGVVCMWAYMAMRQRKTLFTAYLAAILSFCVTISIFVNHFSQIATWFFIAVGYAVHRYCWTDRPQPRSSFRSRIFDEGRG